ncbi:MAG: hypothetical protein U0V70_07345 [Terriglobia bacterium]
MSLTFIKVQILLISLAIAILSISSPLQAQMGSGGMQGNGGSTPPNQSSPTLGGSSYSLLIPYVTRENNRRTNLGLNNYSSRSMMKGDNPDANVLLELYDRDGNMAGSTSVVVHSNQMFQINDVISAFNGNVGTGWLNIYSDEPIDAFATVILNSTNNPVIQLPVYAQMQKPGSYREGQASMDMHNRLFVQSSVKTGTFESSLIVVNMMPTGGDFTIKIYDNSGQLISTKTETIKGYGMYIDDDIRSSVPGSYGQIVIEPNASLLLMANSLVLSANGTAGFFPAVSMPAANMMQMAGQWQASLTGTLINAQVKMTIFQEKGMMYGSMEVTGGTFPVTGPMTFSGEMDPTTNGFMLQANGTSPLFNLTMYMPSFSGMPMQGMPTQGGQMQGKFVYVDEQNRKDVGTWTMTRMGHIFSN